MSTLIFVFLCFVNSDILMIANRFRQIRLVRGLAFDRMCLAVESARRSRLLSGLDCRNMSKQEVSLGKVF